MRASTICGSDLRAIYREHLGTGPEAYGDVVAGHEPSGEIVAVGPGCRRFGVGDRVAIYHIAGCGLCPDCRAGYMISCTSPLRAAYGWQRDGGHADYLLAEESTCVPLPGALSWLDGACVACGFGTAYEALRRARVSGRDAVLVVGLGPVGLAAGRLARALGASLVVGADPVAARRDLALVVGSVDVAVPTGEDAAPGAGGGAGGGDGGTGGGDGGTGGGDGGGGALELVREATGGHGCEVAIDCSGAPPGRALALAGTRRWGRCVLVGEGNRLDVDVSAALIHRQLTVHGSWVTSIGHMEELVELLVRWDVHPDRTVTDRFALEEAAAAYAAADEGSRGKVALVMGP